MSQMPYYHIKKSILLILFLFFPLILRFLEPRLEIYPAILFPTGAAVLNLENDIREFHQTEIYAIRDSIEQINKKEFLGEIPAQYFNYLVKNNFGLEPYLNSFNTSHPKLTFTEKSNFSHKNRIEAKNWVKAKLQNQGFSDSLIIVRQYQLQYSIKSRQLQSHQLVYEKSFELN